LGFNFNRFILIIFLSGQDPPRLITVFDGDEPNFPFPRYSNREIIPVESIFTQILKISPHLAHLRLRRQCAQSLKSQILKKVLWVFFRPLGIGFQEQVSNHHKLHRLRVDVVSVDEKSPFHLIAPQNMESTRFDS
jgi:hypothetical protein